MTYDPEYRAETAYSALFPANFRPKNPTKGDGLHGRGFKQFHVSQSLHVPVAYTSDIKLLGAKDVLIVPCECFGRWPQLF